MAQRLNLSVELGKKHQGGDRSSSESQRLKFILLGCFSGNRESSDPQLNPLPDVCKVDLDNFDDLISEMQPCLKIDLSELTEPLQLRFSSLDDFHPDQLHKQLPTPQESASAERKEPDQTDTQSDSASNGSQESDQQTLSRLLGDGAATTPSSNAGKSNANRTMVESVVGRLIDGSLKQHTAGSSEQETDHSEHHGSLLKNVIHHSEFQTLESNWRGLDWLVRNLESDELNEVFIVDLSQDEWQRSTQSELEFKQSKYYQSLLKRFSEKQASEQKFILICDHYFNSSIEDTDLLKSFSELGTRLDAQLLAATEGGLLSSVDSDPAALEPWIRFQQSAAATNVSLVLPRILMRLPYGEQYDPVESFQFEELDDEWCSDELLWGNPAFALAIQLAADNQSERQQDAAALADCPSFAYLKERESHLQPCTESLFTDQQLEILVELGLVPIVGSRRSNQVRIPWYRRL
ncbi:MAG: type VI secretion system contractile sheath large subunit [Candidatus Thiodiazotropha endolucinida]|nr:type VI secretion system contractile sheath large subunit [Candidatus Thiodiazotropha taylori]MCG8055082.1 type VI secretion system contractile sheath large subunit [Candidatus Thiodiazotropha taylori]MCW4242112.1 type VI secretion system contractile sheath large subunit [Candidatus Thiodiazotropha taylori]MCW4316910.1 type VI secretion system contractile sheath large subunit [Candidatus Thiodiazotropha taylori]